jgi:hypothetical protein
MTSAGCRRPSGQGVENMRGATRQGRDNGHLSHCRTGHTSHCGNSEEAGRAGPFHSSVPLWSGLYLLMADFSGSPSHSFDTNSFRFLTYHGKFRGNRRPCLEKDDACSGASSLVAEHCI